MRPVTPRTAKQLLHNKFVVVLGDSIQRSVYKDLVLMLRRDAYLSVSQLKSKGEFSFEQDCLVEGGRLGEMNNGTAYKEVRQYRTDHHLIRFYFVTRVFSRSMERILTDFETGMKPDLVIVNSCVWDISRWEIPEVAKTLGGFLVPEIQHMGPTLRFDVIEANYFGATLANEYGFDVLDFHFQFRFSLQHRMQDGVHWNAVAHRQITCLLLEHVAQAWGVELPDHDQVKADGHPPLHDSHNWKTATSSALVRHQGPLYSNKRGFNPPVTPAIHYNNAPAWTQGQMMRQFSGFGSQFSGYGAQFYSDSVPPHLTAGYQSFEREPFYRGVNSAAAPYWPVNNLVMKHKQRRPYNPYTRERPRTYRY
ncbi:PC-esterase domain-containing protein 1A [Sinocyclocheilus grahami]|uniref:PC-esterase domain-containing protein 1A n=1 Tax=Sinocyclocheilus grahami TaxID=75366 RepID=UPI0007AC61ED|nr:PREDICTED: PC-esterase domain-containing protein 1A-like [Sinocyclocheilus grahami]